MGLEFGRLPVAISAAEEEIEPSFRASSARAAGSTCDSLRSKPITGPQRF